MTPDFSSTSLFVFPVLDLSFFFNICLFILFLAALGLSCGTQDPPLWRAGSLLQHMGFSLVVAHMVSSCSAWA